MVYNPEILKKHYDILPHGKAKESAIREAIYEADKNSDVPFMVFFREELCSEANFYGNAMYMMTVFPELLSIIDKYPDTPTTQFDGVYDNALDHILWIYKWVIIKCSSFYQIPLEDCKKFFADFKKRYINYGYSLKPYYRAVYYFYNFNKEEEDKAFNKFMAAKRDSNSDCQACERNTEIEFYLNNGNFNKALQLSEDIENFQLRCLNGYYDSWIRVKMSFLNYYIDNGNFEEASKTAHLLEPYIDNRTEFLQWGTIINCYAHTNPGRALRIYKKYWKELEKGGTPLDEFDILKNTCCFFWVIKKQGKESIKFNADISFPLYRKDKTYSTDGLYNYYYLRAEDIALKFDKRSNTDKCIKTLEKALKIADI